MWGLHEGKHDEKNCRLKDSHAKQRWLLGMVFIFRDFQHGVVRHTLSMHHRMLHAGTMIGAHLSFVLSLQRVPKGNGRYIRLPARIESEIVDDGPRHQFGDSCFLRHLSTRGTSLLVEMFRGVRMHVEHHHVHLTVTEHRRYKCLAVSGCI